MANSEEKGFNIGPLLELGAAAMSSIKAGEKGVEVDFRKLGQAMAVLAGQQVLSRVLSGRNERDEKMLEAANVLRERQGLPELKLVKKKSVVPSVLWGGLMGVTGFVASLKSDEREQLFQKLEEVMDAVGHYINEFQGKPYSADYESSKPS